MIINFDLQAGDENPREISEAVGAPRGPTRHPSIIVLLRWLLFPLTALVSLLLWPLRALRRARAAPAGALVELTLSGRLLESPSRPRGRLERWLDLGRDRGRSRRASVFGVARLVDEIVADPKVAGLVVVWSEVEAGWATLEALAEVLARVPAAGKRLAAYLPDGADDRSLFALAAARPLIVAPAADVALKGSRSEGLYFAGALDRLGIDVELHARGAYKSAGDTFARTARSDADREQTSAILGAIDEALVDALAKGRGKTRAEVDAWIDAGPTRATEALERGIIDAVAHDHALVEALGAPLVPAGRYFARRARRSRSGRRVGIVQVHGTIAKSSSPFARATGPLAGSAQVVADLRLAAADPSIAAVVLDVESPGGTVTASDAILAEARVLAAKKPVVVRFGEVAASGGYWVAMSGHRIVARALTITGSIGVVGMRPIAARLMERLGVVRDVVALRPFADLEALTRAPSEAERALVARDIDAHYAAFVKLVAEGRRRPIEAIEPIAQGRVWMGAAAHARGLVDELGGLERALAVAGELLRDRGAPPVVAPPMVIAARAPVPRATTPEARSKDAAALASLLPRPLRALLAGAAPWLAMIEEGAPVALLAALPSLPSFVTAAAPVADAFET